MPLYRSLGIAADWLVIPGTPAFFEVTKRIHNGLQGGRVVLSERARQLYLEHTRQIAELTEPGYDVIVVHDPQPAAVRHVRGRGGGQWVWRCHIDTSEPNSRVLQFLLPFLADYDALVFTLDEFIPAPLRDERVTVIAPAIDPLSPKNLTLPTDIGQQIIQWADSSAGTFQRRSWRCSGRWRSTIPRAGRCTARSWTMPEQTPTSTYSRTSPASATARSTPSNPVRRSCCRNRCARGFGLVVSETLWKGTPVVAGRAGGIPLQLPEGTGGYLVDNVEQCAARTVELLRDPRRAARLGAAGQQHVREHFLITRLLADELRLLGALVAGASAQPTECARSVGE